jgi:hypothetical protein
VHSRVARFAFILLIFSSPVYAKHKSDYQHASLIDSTATPIDILQPSGLSDCDCSVVPEIDPPPRGLGISGAISICFTLSSPQAVQIKIFSMTGKEVIRLGGIYKEGNQSCKWDASNVTSGIFFCKIITHDKTLIKKITVIK